MDVIDELGGPSAVALMAGCKPPSVTEWRRRGIPHGKCWVLEQRSGGRVPCERMRTDIVWYRVPDPEWPWHPDGRPLIDVTRQGIPTTQAAPAADQQEVRHAA